MWTIKLKRNSGPSGITCLYLTFGPPKVFSIMLPSWQLAMLAGTDGQRRRQHLEGHPCCSLTIILAQLAWCTKPVNSWESACMYERHNTTQPHPLLCLYMVHSVNQPVRVKQEVCVHLLNSALIPLGRHIFCLVLKSKLCLCKEVSTKSNPHPQYKRSPKYLLWGEILSQLHWTKEKNNRHAFLCSCCLLDKTRLGAP